MRWMGCVSVNEVDGWVSVNEMDGCGWDRCTGVYFSESHGTKATNHFLYRATLVKENKFNM